MFAVAAILLQQPLYFRMTSVLVRYQGAQSKFQCTMLTAQKENKHLTLVQRPPTLRSVETVVHSIDGLRERVQGFTVEQLSETERTFQSMSLRLGALQQTISALSEIKALMGKVEQLLPQAQAATVDESTLASAGSFTPLHSLPHVGNIAKFRRIIKLVKAVESVSGLLESSDSKDRALVLDIDANAEPARVDRVVATLTAIEYPFAEAVQNSAIVTPAGQGNNEGSEHSQRLATSATDFVRTEPNCGEAFDIISAKEATSSCKTMDESVAASEHRAGSDAVTLASTPSDQSDSSIYNEPDFDRRLLDDVIKNYGEFNVVPNLPATTKAKKEVKHDAAALKRAADSTTTTNSASHRNFPAQRKDGELDRKLKKLIKDYGEYDLYSRHSPLNLKTCILVAFLLLSLVFSGFYFFSIPKSIRPAANSSSAVQSQAEGKPTANGETLSTGSVSNFDVPKPAEAGSSRNISSNIITKKTR